MAEKQRWQRRACGEGKIQSWRRSDQGIQPWRQQNTILEVDGEAVEAAEVEQAGDIVDDQLVSLKKLKFNTSR